MQQPFPVPPPPRDYSAAFCLSGFASCEYFQPILLFFNLNMARYTENAPSEPLVSMRFSGMRHTHTVCKPSAGWLGGLGTSVRPQVPSAPLKGCDASSPFRPPLFPCRPQSANALTCDKDRGLGPSLFSSRRMWVTPALLQFDRKDLTAPGRVGVWPGSGGPVVVWVCGLVVCLPDSSSSVEAVVCIAVARRCAPLAQDRLPGTMPKARCRARTPRAKACVFYCLGRRGVQGTGAKGVS